MLQRFWGWIRGWDKIEVGSLGKGGRLMKDWQCAVVRYVQNNIEDNRDPSTGEANAVKLAWGACFRFCPWCFDDLEALLRWMESELLDIVFAVVELDANRMSEAEAKKWIEKHGRGANYPCCL